MTLRLATLWLVVPVVGALVGALAKPLPPHDFWWQLAMGRQIANDALPSTNLFLYTLPADLPFVNQPWLGQLVMWLTYDAGGTELLLLLRGVLVVVMISLLLAIALRRGATPQLAGGLGLLAVLIALPVLAVRTRMFAFVPLALTLFVCQAVVDKQCRSAWLALLIPSTIFWANTHGTFILAVLIVGAYGVGDVLEAALRRDELRHRVVRWGLAIAGVCAASAVTPLGVDVFGYVMQLTNESSVSDTVTEWQPPDLTDLHGKLVVFGIIVGTAALVFRRRHITITDALLWGGMMVLAAQAMRASLSWAVMFIVVLAPAVSRPQEATEPTPGERRFVGVTIAMLAVVALAPQPGLGFHAIFSTLQPPHVRRTGEGAWAMANINAYRAIERVVQDDRGRVFHDQAIGGMLEVYLTQEPAQVAFVDQRMEFIPEEVWARYFGLSDAQDGWERELQRWEVDTLILSPVGQHQLMQAALQSADWELVLVDEAHLLFYRSLDRAQDPPK